MHLIMRGIAMALTNPYAPLEQATPLGVELL